MKKYIILIVLMGGLLQSWGQRKNQQIRRPVKNETKIEVHSSKKKKQTKKTTPIVKNMEYNSVIGTYSYTGEVDADQKPHGKGKAVYQDGGIYEGDFYHGTFSGKGTLRKSDGTIYDGTFYNNLLVNGRHTAKSGSYFIGTFKGGQTSSGTWYDRNGNVKTIK